MERSEFDRLPVAIDPDVVRGALIAALTVAASAAGDSYEYGQPRTDGYTFGADLWRFVWHEMEVQVGALPGASVTRPRGSLLIQLGDVVLYPFRYGGSLTDDVRAAHLTDSGVRRDLLTDPASAQQPLFSQHVVLVAYAAEEKSGLLRAYIGSAYRADQDALDWQWLEELELGAGPSGTPLPVPATAWSVPAFARPPEPELDLSLVDADVPDQGAGG